MTATTEDHSDRGPARLLLVEDDRDDARRIEAHLEESGIPYNLVHVDTLERALSALDEDRYDLCLLDLGLPDSADVEVDDRLWTRVGDLPLVVMSGLDELDRAMAALQAGAEGYLVKDGITPGVLGRLLRTVLERDRARREQRKAEEKWTSVFAASPVAIVLSDADSGRRLEVNDAFVEMFGPSREELLGASSPERSQWEDPDRRRELVERVRHDGYVTGEEAAYRNARGRRGWMLMSCRRLELADGDRLLWTIQDITEQKRRKEALRRSEARYRTLVETMAEATVILDDDGRITFANAEAEDVLGLEESEMQGRSYDDPEWAITASDGGGLPVSQLPFRRVMETGESVRNVEHAIVRPDGRRTILSVNAAPMDEKGSEVGKVVATLRDVTEQKRLETQLEHQALHDPLTGLANRALFEDRLEQALARSRRRGEPMGLLMLDLDGFKRVNDLLGHTAGDEVLEQVARRLEATVREADTVARWGGDEFVVVLPELDRPEVIEAAQNRLHDAVRTPIHAGDEELELGLTVGGVVQASGDILRAVGTDDPEDLVRFVDLALHRAKRQSPGGFYLFDPTDNLDEVPDLRLEHDLRRGLRAGEIEVFYQPIYHLEDDELWGLEALARWRHPERGLVSPGAFIPLAERVGLIGQLGDEVRRQGFKQLAAWTRNGEGGSDLKLAVNLSARELGGAGLTDRMAKALEGAALAPDLVVVEVTETAMMTSMGQARALRAVGIALCVDDFGTGYSTFTYLRELEPDGLKIDMSLVRGLPESTSDVAIVDSLITLANRLDLAIVAEGIETEAQLRTLRDLGADLGQGFLLGRPAPADEIEGLLDGEPARSGGGMRSEPGVRSLK